MAAGGVNIKMGVTGVAQFKQSISQARSNLKTLDAQLQLTEKQYKATGDAETYMQQKTEQLKSKLEEQKAIAASAEQALAQMTERGVDKGSAAFQNMIQTLARAKGDMLDTEAALQGIEESSDGASDGVSEMNSQLASIGQGISWQNVTEGLDDITAGIGSVITKAWQMGEALVRATLGAGSWADELKTTSDQYADLGLDPEKLQRMRKTAQVIDTEADTILEAQDKLKKGREGQSEEFMGALAYLGIDPSGKDDLSLFWEAGEALSKLGKNEDKVTYAQRLYGKSWRELMPLFKAGREEYDRTMESWSVVENDQIDNLGKMDDAYQKMSSEWETFKNELLSAFAGPLTQGMETITGLFQELNKYLDTPEGQAMLAQIGETISSLITDLTNIDPAEVVAGFQAVVNGVTDALKWIDEHHDDVVTAMEVIVGGWALLELTGGVLDVLKIINAVQGIGITSSTAAAAGRTAGASWAGAFASAAMKAAPFLAFLYTLLNPSDGTDELGNNNLLDKNGELTEEAKAYGYTKNEKGELVQEETPDWLKDNGMHGRFSEAQYQLLQKYWDKYRTGTSTAEDWQEIQGEFGKSGALWDKFVELANEIYTLDKTMEDLPEELFANPKDNTGNSEMAEAAKGLNGLPDRIARTLNGTKVVIDGGQLTAYVGQVMAGVMAQYTV